MKTWHKALLAAAGAVLLGVVAFAGFALRWQHQALDVTERTVVVLEAGEPFARFAARLHERGLVAHPRLWTWYARLADKARRAQAGEYEVLTGDTPALLLSRIVAGEVVRYDVRILEGWTAMQAVAQLEAHPALDHRIGNVTVHTLLEVLGLSAGHAEGLFFPDTYHFVRGDSDADIMRRAYQRMESVLAQAWEERASRLPYETPYQALIAASLIEKETGREADRPVISQVFALRLHRGMRLQTDPAVIYGVGETFDGNLTRAHLRTAGPYNTYRNRGLPPTPIALPGAESIRAALHPADGEYLYFVSRGDGSSEFSRSLDEHERAVRHFQLGEMVEQTTGPDGAADE